MPGSNALVTAGTIRVGADWFFKEGTNATLGTGNTVIFDGITSNFLIHEDADAAFGNLEFAKPSPYALTYLHCQIEDTLRVAGNLTVYEGNKLSLNTHRMIVSGNFDVRPTAYVTVHQGYLQLNEDAVVLEGKLDVHNGTVLLKGTFEEAVTGELVIPGGSFKSDAPATGGWQQIRGLFTMSDGTFEIVRNGIMIAPTAVTSITGGSMITGFGFNATAPGTFQPAGGIEKVNVTPSYYTALTCTNGNYFQDVEINAPCMMGSDLTIKDDLLITNNGSLDSDIYDITIEGDWTDNAWPNGFIPHNNYVWFSGANDADILTSEDFGNLGILKTNENTMALELSADKTVNVSNDLQISNGCFRLNGGCNLVVSNDITIASGAGLNAASTPAVNITVKGDWLNSNATITGPELGFHPGDESLVTFSGIGNSFLQAVSGRIFLTFGFRSPGIRSGQTITSFAVARW
jgi:hypothetical protein